MDANGQHAMANCYLDTPSAFAASTFSGKSFAFDMNGEKASSSGSGTVFVGRAGEGRFSATGGTITSGILDIGKAGNPAAEEETFTGSYTTPDANGRITLTFTAGSGSETMAAYIIDSKRMFILDITAGAGLFVGNARTQSGTVSSDARSAVRLSSIPREPRSAAAMFSGASTPRSFRPAARAAA